VSRSPVRSSYPAAFLPAAVAEVAGLGASSSSEEESSSEASAFSSFSSPSQLKPEETARGAAVLVEEGSLLVEAMGA
jgi:hypothetical protein